MAISRFSSDDYPKLGVYQIVANQSRKLGIWRSLNEGGRTAPCFLRFPQREKYQLCPDGKQNRNYRWHRSPALDAIRGPRALGQPRPFAVFFAQVAPRGVLLP